MSEVEKFDPKTFSSVFFHPTIPIVKDPQLGICTLEYLQV
jgi:hypothetical protein